MGRFQYSNGRLQLVGSRFATTPVDTNMIDSFEDGDIGEYSGATGEFEPQDWSGTFQGAADGDYVLSRSSDNSSFQTITSTSGLESYPQRGDSFQVWFYVADAGYDELFFPFVTQTSPSSSLPDGYAIEVNPYQDRFGIYKDGSALITASASYSSDNWYYANVTFDDAGDGEIVAVLYTSGGAEKERISATDTTYDTGGIGWRRYARASAAQDYAHLHDVVESPPQITLIDSFEDGDISEYDGDTSGYSTTTSVSDHGSYALSLGSSGAYQHIGSNSGLDNYVDQGDTWQFKWRSSVSGGGSSTSRIMPGYAIGDTTNLFDNSYLVRISVDGSDVQLQRYNNSDGGTNIITLADILGNYNAGEWWTVECEWATDDTHTLTVYDNNGNVVDSGSATDSTHSGVNGTFGTVQFKDSGVSQYIDTAEIV
jgi:hypothetical protein